MNTLPVILIAGWGHTSRAMMPLQKSLGGAAGQVISTGELWNSLSGTPSQDLAGISRYDAALRRLLAGYRGRACVIGWSMGGIVALETARARPELIRQLVIIGGTPRYSAANDEPPGVSSSILRAMARQLRRSRELTLSAFYGKVYAPESIPVDVAVAQSNEIAVLNTDELQHGLEYLRQTDLRQGLDKITVPTLVLHGREDRIVPWQAGEWLSRALRFSQWRCYRHAGHALPVMASEQLAADIRTFLGS